MIPIAVVVPVLNEAQQFPGLLARLAELPVQQVILVDGGSTDGSVEVITKSPFTLVQSERGRARQMNAGARVAGAEILLFLHADTQLPAQACELIQQGLSRGGHGWGRFDARIDGDHWLLPIIARMMSLRSRVTGICTGDQAIFIHRALFERVGGFADIPLMEDVEFTKRLKKIKRPVCLSAKVVTSGRRWLKKGPFKTMVLMWYLRFLYAVGVSPARLAKLYR